MPNTYNPTVLSLEQLRLLNDTCYFKEMATIKNASTYKSAAARANDMRACNDAHTAVQALLSQEQNEPPYPDPQQESTRQLIWESTRGSLRNGLENIRNMGLRKEYIQCIADNVGNFRSRLVQANQDVSKIQEIAREAVAARNYTLDVTRAKLSKSALGFSQWMKEQGVTFEKLQAIYTQKNSPEQDSWTWLTTRK